VPPDSVAIRSPPVPIGGALIHHSDTWHGSGPNRSDMRHRRALAVHLIRRDLRFRTDSPPDYIYGRYQLHGSDEVEETFFPVTFTPTGYRSPTALRLCSDPIPVEPSPE